MENNQRLLRDIRSATSATMVLRILNDYKKLTPLNEYLTRAMETANMTVTELAELIGVERSTLYRVISGERLTSRNVLLRIALVLRFGLEQAQKLLCLGQRAALYPLVPRDSLLVFSIEHAYTLQETDDMLRRKGMPDLYERM